MAHAGSTGCRLLEDEATSEARLSAPDVEVDHAKHLSVKLLKNGILKIYPGFPHGMLTTHADVINQDLLACVRN